MINSLRILANKYLGKRALHFVRNIRNVVDDAVMARPRQRFYGQFIKKGSLCFDVGANIGNRVKPFLALGAKVVAVEPQNECCDIMRKRFGDSIIIINKGLGEQEEKREFFVSDASTISTFSSDWIAETTKTNRFEGYTWSDVRQVELTTLDNLISQYGLPNFIKIDVEGFEIEVLKGLSQPIGMLSFEYGVPEFSDRLKEILLRIKLIYQDQLLCNYAAGEDMHWCLNDWITVDRMLQCIESDEFLATSAGDVYVKMV